MSAQPSSAVRAKALEGVNLECLRARWREAGGEPPALRSVDLLAHMLAWRIQCEGEGGLDADLRRNLRRSPKVAAIPGPSGGTKLVREWQGVRHEVVAMNDGRFVYLNVQYRSLSQIARVITGVRWNGPRFFGLRQGAGRA